MAADVAAVLDEAGIAQAHVFGISLGGMIAQAFALSFPSRLDRLVLGCTSPGGLRSVKPKVGSFLAMARARLQSQETACRLEAENVLSDSFRARHPEVIDHWLELARQAPVPRSTMMLQLLAAGRHDAYSRLPTIDAMTLVIAPDADRLIPPENSHLLARRIPRAELAWVRGAGHDFVTERPKETFTMVREFLESS
jgi:pimeloyl-ACP methyl ester carboxylesterase